MGASFFRTPRTSRLERDFKEMQELQEQSTILEFEAIGSPPERYIVTFHGASLVPNGKIRLGNVQKAEIRLMAEYPRIRPDIKWLTPIAHPNIFGGTVCLGKFSMEWVLSVKLVEVVEIMWDMARMAVLNPHSAGPSGGEQGTTWAELDQKFGFPVDKRSLRDKVARRGEGSSILRPDPDGDDDIMVIDDAGVCGLGACCDAHAFMAGVGEIGDDEGSDPIMDIANNEYDLYEKKIIMFDRWVEMGDRLNAPQAHREAMSLARWFTGQIRAKGYEGRYRLRDIREAADEMIEEFDEHREYAIKKGVEHATHVPTSEEMAMDPGDIAHAEKYEQVAQVIGIDVLRDLIPAPPEKVQKALERGDKYLNTIPLYKWDAAAGMLSAPDLSLSDKVCALKHVAKWHYV